MSSGFSVSCRSLRFHWFCERCIHLSIIRTRISCTYVVTIWFLLQLQVSLCSYYKASIDEMVVMVMMKRY